MDVEDKLDEDFLFFTNFTSTFLKRINDRNVFRKCMEWILKLCTEPCEGVDRKRCRNMYLSNLLVHMQNEKLEEPFLRPPFSVDISDAMEVFCSIPDSLEKPAWLDDLELDLGNVSGYPDKSGRTYFATKTLPNEQGAFAYIGVSLTGSDWMNPPMAAGDATLHGPATMEDQIAQTYREHTPEYQIGKILAKRKNPEERQRVLTFYDTLLQLLANELSGEAPEFNETVEGLLGQLVADLKDKGQYDNFCANMNDYEKRTELLVTLYDRIKIRRDKLAAREEFLDDTEQKVMRQLFEVPQVEPDDEYQLPAAMWQQAIEKMPHRRHMEALKQKYPNTVVKKFISYLTSFKEEIVERVHKRHQRIATQMKKDLRNETAKKKKEVEEKEITCIETEKVYRAVTEHWRETKSAVKHNRNQQNIEGSDHTLLYAELRATALDAQKLVEEEDARGKFLAEQINNVAEQNDIVKEIHDESIKKWKSDSAKILNRIREINEAIRRYKRRIEKFRLMEKSTGMILSKTLSGELYF
ncbi:uncharacterized protein [Euwallacea fornicatus]|uniref:uncharacterized protein n=1 Tax=Euwallacea fornicatus TaxID=995702 RepID=UPI0033900851